MQGAACSSHPREHTQHEAAVATALLLAASKTSNLNFPLHPVNSDELRNVVDSDLAQLSDSMQGEIMKIRDQMAMLQLRAAF